MERKGLPAERFVYVIVASAPDGTAHRYVGQAMDVGRRMATHRSKHGTGRHRNIPAEFLVNWEAVEVYGPYTGTYAQVAEGQEQAEYQRCLAVGPVLNKLPPKCTISLEAVVPATLAENGRRVGSVYGKIYGPINGRLTGRRNAENGHMERMRARISPETWQKMWDQAAERARNGWARCGRAKLTPEALKRGGQTAGRANVESGALARARASTTLEQQRAWGAMAKKNPETHARVCARARAVHWGVQSEPGLWVSRKSGAVLLDERGGA